MLILLTKSNENSGVTNVKIITGMDGVGACWGRGVDLLDIHIELTDLLID